LIPPTLEAVFVKIKVEKSTFSGKDSMTGWIY
jgi:hypothetical protein